MLIAWDFVTLGFCNYEEALDVWLEESVCVEWKVAQKALMAEEGENWHHFEALGPWPLVCEPLLYRETRYGGGGGHPFPAWLARKSKTVKCSPQTSNKLEIEDVLVIGRNIPDENKGPPISQHKVRLM